MSMSGGVKRNSREAHNLQISGSTPVAATNSVEGADVAATEQSAVAVTVSPEKSTTYHASRGGNSNGLHVTQGSAPESDRQSAGSELDGTQMRNGCVAQMDMPRNKAAVPGDGASTSPVYSTSGTAAFADSTSISGAPDNALRSKAGFIRHDGPRVYTVWHEDPSQALHLVAEPGRIQLSDDCLKIAYLEGQQDEFTGVFRWAMGLLAVLAILTAMAAKFHWF